MSHIQGDIAGSTFEPDLPCVGLNEGIFVPASLKDDDSCRVVRKLVDKLIGEGGHLDFDCRCREKEDRGEVASGVENLLVS